MLLIAAIDNARIREILPLLRPRAPEPTLFSQTVWYLFLAGLATLVLLYFLRRYRLFRRQQLEFTETGAELGLSRRQIELLRKVWRREHMKNPQWLLTSSTIFDRHVGAFITRVAKGNLDHPVLDKIAAIREVLAFDELPAAKALNSTRQIEKGQSFLLWQVSDVGEGVSPWLLVARNEGALPVIPVLKDDTSYLTDLKVGDRISARFWREGDTEYRFDSQVVKVEGNAYLLEHADVERQQQRDFFRVNVDFDVTLFALPANGGTSTEQEGDEPRDVEEDAAIALLDREEAEDSDDAVGKLPRSAGLTELLPPESDTDSPLPMDQESAHRIDASVTNISASGMSITVHGDLPPGDHWVVDPAFDGSFPLASVACRIIGTPSARNTGVKLKFENLSTQAEGDIVHLVYQHQLMGAGGLHSYDLSTNEPADADIHPTSTD